MNCFKCKNGKSSRKIEKINIENPNIEKEINLGEHYIDNDNDSEHSDLSSLNQKRNMFNKDFRLRTLDIINTPEEMPTYRKKIELLTTRLMTYKNDIQSHLFDISNDTNSISNNIYIDELDEDYRGFSYHSDAALDMRMDTDNDLSAYTVVNNYDYNDLVRILRDYGEEKYATSIARNIVKYRENKNIETTLELVEIIQNSVPMKAKREHHPARKVFQAIRIEVNQDRKSVV